MNDENAKFISFFDFWSFYTKWWKRYPRKKVIEPKLVCFFIFDLSIRRICSRCCNQISLENFSKGKNLEFPSLFKPFLESSVSKHLQLLLPIALNILIFLIWTNWSINYFKFYGDNVHHNQQSCYTLKKNADWCITKYLSCVQQRLDFQRVLISD